MIRGIHAMFYTTRANQARAFMRDKLGLPFTDVGGGWLIFDAPAGDIGFHPAEKPDHEVSFYCDDLEETMSALKKKGVEFTQEVRNQGWGRMTMFRMPGAGEVMLYQPLYEKGAGKKAARAAKASKPKAKAAAKRPAPKKAAKKGKK